ncbi:hypothetical protein [Vannielia litorea]|uniref:Uncharacterized protein n=1 Tax=Vannielia litorea TaxID=1217970 RepID=A0A1N6ET97_9RHOB|nr:hypothetical protein [Vannielia litorea]SIN86228.1 hypothetical protein SAMN05444002_1080 [Vannielia litorea]
MRAAVLALLLSAAPAWAQAPTPQQMVAACISLTEAALRGAEGSRRAALEADLDLMRKALRGLETLGPTAGEALPPGQSLPTRLSECTDAA